MLITCIIIFTVINIFKYEFDRKRRKNKEIIRLNRSLTNLTVGFIWSVLFIIWSTIFINNAQKLYQLLNEEYIDSVFELLNVEYLRSLRRYFYENLMLTELNTIAYYESNFFGIVTWIIASFSLSVLYLQRGWHKNIIYENGVLINGKIIDWNEIINYEWGNGYKERLFKDERYYELKVTLPKSKLWDLDNKVKLKVNYDDKGLVDDIFKKLTN
ncbi:MAG: hypothetical protein JJT76_10830 [Clostridiaceae bacterium]|nr:hypothetical protein [Clostridiaceae bacterium]